MRKLFWILILQVPLFSNAQEDPYSWAKNENMLDFMKFYFNPLAKDVQMQKLGTDIEFEEKKKIILQLGVNQWTKNHLNSGYAKDIAESYHLIDLNGDNNLDVVYNAAPGSDGPIFTVWLKTNGYRKVISEPWAILQCIALDTAETEFIAYNTGPFGALTSKIQSFKIRSTEVIMNEVEFHVATKFPKEYLQISKFIVQNDGYNLRSYPEVKNKPCEEQMDPDTFICGSKYVTLNSETQGLALSKSTDQTGRIWWFSVVEVDFGIKKLGWLSSRYVTKN